MKVMSKAPDIRIDYSLCTTPFLCKRCLEACNPAVFHVESAKYERGRESNPAEPSAYKVGPRYRYSCTLCGDCVRACPVKAIAIGPA